MTTVTETLTGFERWLRDPMLAKSKDEHGAFSFSTFREGIRGNDHAEGCRAFGGDVDDGESDLETAVALAGKYLAFAYTTFSHRREAPRYRLVLPYSRRVTGDEHRTIWAHLAAHFAASGVRIDPATKDPARLFFVPCVAPGEEFIFARNDGRLLDVDTLLESAREDEAEDERQRKAARVELGSTPTIDRVRRYVDRMDAAVSGSGGHRTAFRVACVIVANIADEATQAMVFDDYNRRCEPPWSARELAHKLKDARRRADLRPLSNRGRP